MIDREDVELVLDFLDNGYVSKAQNYLRLILEEDKKVER
jgi:hypothetical protein